MFISIHFTKIFWSNGVTGYHFWADFTCTMTAFISVIRLESVINALLGGSLRSVQNGTALQLILPQPNSSLFWI
jgi:hypothetical protein